MDCVVITRNGKGEALRFDSLRAARLHPIPQSWDVFATTPEELVRQYSRSEIDVLLKYMEGRDRARVIHAIEEWKSGRPSGLLPSDIRSLLWDKVLEVSVKPPVSADEILKIIVEDRKALEGTVIISRPEGDSVPRITKSTGENEMGEKREVFRMHDDGVISFGVDDKGVKYSAENTPKRGEKTTANFAKYREGMTVKEALDSGLTRSNVRRDRRAGFITIQNPPEEPKAAEGEAAGNAEADTAKESKKTKASADESPAAAE